MLSSLSITPSHCRLGTLTLRKIVKKKELVLDSNPKPLAWGNYEPRGRRLEWYFYVPCVID